ncbi:MAG: alpha/beta hydrolase [Rhodobiaceae bacterium]|nr:MAG: alpha/beta hydrolase [Rhodobiaceae bacterium]
MISRIIKILVVLVVGALLALFIAYGAFDKSADELRPLYASDTSQFLTLPSGATVHYRDEGNAAGPALLLIHGSNASLHTWEPWVKLLGDDYRVVSLDLPGHGLTGGHESDVYTRAGQVAFVKEFVDAIGLSAFVLGGNSMGGGVTLQYALTHGDDLRGIIPVSSGGMPRDPDASSPLIFQLASMPVVNQLMLYITPRSMIVEGLQKAVEDDALVTPEMVDRYYDLALYDGNRAATRARFQGYAAGASDSLADELKAVSLPTLIIWGENDRLIPVASAHAMAAALPQAKLVIYENVGHIAMEEVAEASAGEVRAFMESLVVEVQPDVAPPLQTLCGDCSPEPDVIPSAPEE